MRPPIASREGASAEHKRRFPGSRPPLGTCIRTSFPGMPRALTNARRTCRPGDAVKNEDSLSLSLKCFSRRTREPPEVSIRHSCAALAKPLAQSQGQKGNCPQVQGTATASETPFLSAQEPRVHTGSGTRGPVTARPPRKPTNHRPIAGKGPGAQVSLAELDGGWAQSRGCLLSP